MIKATIVLLAAWLIVPRLRSRSAAERHALWAAALAVAATLPLLSIALPSWQPAWAQRAAGVWPAAFETAPPAVTTAGDIVIRATGVEPGGWLLLDTIGLLWVLGTGLAILILAGRALQLNRLTAAATPADDARLAIATHVAVSLGLTTTLVRHSPHIAIPLAWGIRCPRILLPDAARAWSDERVWAVCAHELAHIVRRDWPVHVLTEVVCRIYWFHPLFWLARNHLRRESERAADDVVIGLGADGAEYASHLVEIVRAARQQPVGVTVAMARRSDLESRVTALLNALANRTRLSRGRGLVLVIGTLMVAFPLAALKARGGVTIEIRTSNLPPLDAVPARDTLADDTGEPLRGIRVLSGATTPPDVAEYTTPPLYSDEARRRGIEGRLVLRARIEPDGRVSEARVAKGLGFGLDQNALVALRQWRFIPGTRGGTAVASDVELEIEFTLRNESINAQIANDMVSLVGPGVTPPRAVRVVSLRPRRTGSSGTVVLDVVLLEDGTPRIVRILQSLGSDIDDIAVSTFEQWRFSPALKDGRPIKVRMNAEVKFHG
jgi:TonB family protein